MSYSRDSPESRLQKSVQHAFAEGNSVWLGNGRAGSLCEKMGTIQLSLNREVVIVKSKYLYIPSIMLNRKRSQKTQCKKYIQNLCLLVYVYRSVDVCSLMVGSHPITPFFIEHTFS
jgi:hypothetical protein